ncbi:hypothetical protein ACFS6H_02745 [Terrimonas rubra]|uniref:Uncharacterized protein n=1 Tax=Terrimonas rubra TaxID=1035890 RepID=A0ABW6A194_9BACT
MRIEELVGKTITNIYSIINLEQGGLDKGECFIELDNTIVIDIPFGESTYVYIKGLTPAAKSLFEDLSDIPLYYVNKDNKSIETIAVGYLQQKRSLLGRIKRLLGQKLTIKDYLPYKIEYQENKLKYIQNRKIVDFLWYEDESEKGFIELDNGFIITETTIANNGTGLVGLHYYEDYSILLELKGNNILRLKDKQYFNK